jgi:hypothetical protein
MDCMAIEDVRHRALSGTPDRLSRDCKSVHKSWQAWCTPDVHSGYLRVWTPALAQPALATGQGTFGCLCNGGGMLPRLGESSSWSNSLCRRYSLLSLRLLVMGTIRTRFRLLTTQKSCPAVRRAFIIAVMGVILGLRI